MLNFASTPQPRISRQSDNSTFSAEILAMAWLMGCVELRASAAAKFWNSEFWNSEFCCAATSGLPIVSVPVLSKITAVIFPAFSNATPSRIKMPRRAAALALAMMAAGVAKPIAHGQATIKTPAAMTKAFSAPE